MHALQRAEHAVQLRAIASADLLHVGTQQVAAQISIHDGLVEVGRVQIVRLLADNALAKELGLAYQEAHAQAGGDHLGKAAHQRHMTVRVKGLDGRQAFARIAQGVIGVILRHQDIILRGQRGNALAALQRHGHARGVLEGGNGIQHARPMAANGLLQRVYTQSILVAVHRDDAQLMQMHGLRGAKEGGILGQYHIARIGISIQQQIEGLRGAGYGQDAARVGGYAEFALQIARQAFAQGGQSLGHAVLQQHLAVGSHQLAADIGHNFIRQRGGGRVAAAEGDDARPGGQLEQLADGAAADALYAGGETFGFLHGWMDTPFRFAG